MTKGKLYLIPSPLGEGEPSEVIPASVLGLLPTLDCFVVEEVRTARRYLSKAGLKGHIDALEFHELNEHTAPAEVEPLIHLFDQGRNVGLISEAGLPAVADPGARLVALCHRNGIEVVPMVGPSSLMLALMASGLNGQSFAFNGYLPVETPQRVKALKKLETKIYNDDQTQSFIETPYRNAKMIDTILNALKPQTKLCIAAGITTPDEFIKTKTIEQWKKEKSKIPDLNKIPAIFVLYK